ncbi:MAG: 1-acyl-sn-glycerol-3-phosphate acyltransferase [Desulfovibrio sp.]|nr:1-acyl-sn-glycerol-3-phosphate acyltransferase [Desulfovibrio sp.]
MENLSLNQKFHLKGSYHSQVRPRGLAKFLPSPLFYSKLLLGPFFWLCLKAWQQKCDDVIWVDGSIWFTELLEEIGCPIMVEGLDYLDSAPKPCVFVANHMSTLETFALPAIIRPFTPVTFVIKDSLVKLPFFGRVMRSRDPIVVGRKNPREDLAHILTEGQKRLKAGISIIVFPQSTRMTVFDPHKFNSIGEKLAKKAQVPLVPLALKTDAWTTGRLIKEIGPLHAGLPIHFSFDQARFIQNNAKEVHEKIITFITTNLAKWSSDQPVR